MAEILALITLVVTGIGVHLQYRSYTEQRRRERSHEVATDKLDDT